MAPAGSVDLVSERRPLDQENERLRGTVSSLRAVLGTERGRREDSERECATVLQEFQRLEQRLLGAEGCAVRVQVSNPQSHLSLILSFSHSVSHSLILSLFLTCFYPSFPSPLIFISLLCVITT